MKQFILTFLLLAFAIAGSYARKVEHVVQRGETIEGIASKYGLTPQSVLTGNNVDRVYVGLKLDIEIPDTPKQNMHSNNMAQQFISPEEASLAKEAKYAFENKDYDKAVKQYNKLVKKFPSSAYYFNRGLAQFKRGKNRQASEDFRRALDYEDCSSYVQEHAPELIEVADARHAQWQQEQGQMWGSLILGTLAAGAQTWANIEAAKTYSEVAPVYNTTPIYSSYVSTSATPVADAMENGSYFQNAFSDLMNLSIQQSQMQMQQEQQAVYNQYLSVCNMTGTEPTQQGWNDYYTQYCVAMTNQRYGSSDDDNGGSGSSLRSSRNSNSGGNTTVTSMNKCVYCNGTGRIAVDKSVANFGLHDPIIICEECGRKVHRSTGHMHVNCGHCGGTGVRK